MSTFRANPAGIAAICRTPAMRAAMLDRAEKVADRARQIAPVDTGRYRDSIEASTEEVGGKVVGVVSSAARNDDGEIYSSFVEFGTSEMDGQRVLGRALDALRGP